MEVYYKMNVKLKKLIFYNKATSMGVPHFIHLLTWGIQYALRQFFLHKGCTSAESALNIDHTGYI